MPETHLVTGATGLVGSSLVLELLRSSDDRVVCIVRPHDDEKAAQERLQKVLLHVARIFNMPELRSEIPLRCRAIPGDLALERCGVNDRAQVGPVSQFWHSAASLRYEETHKDEIFAQNVQGTQHALELARYVGAGTFNHISTAYVSGRQQGRILEEIREIDSPVKNFYEKSKLHGEHMVASSGIHYRILRPSVVIGHSKTCAVINPSGFYGIGRFVAQLRRKMAAADELHRIAETEVLGVEDVTLNLIPVDAVAFAAVRISQSGHPGKVFHLTSSHSPTIGTVMRSIRDTLGIPGPRLVPSPAPEAPEYEFLTRKSDFYVRYFQIPQEFDRTNTDAVIGRDASRWDFGYEDLRRFVGWWLEEFPPPPPSARR